LPPSSSPHSLSTINSTDELSPSTRDSNLDEAPENPAKEIGRKGQERRRRRRRRMRRRFLSS